MFGTNPFSIAAPAGGRYPFVLDMSTTAVPTGRVRAAARAGLAVPEGWLADDQQAHLRDGVPLAEPLYLELRDVAGTLALPVPDPIGTC